MLPLLDFDAIARTPKVFMGFSDATFILNALVERAGMVCFHGPMVAMDFARGLTRGLARSSAPACSAGEMASFELPARLALKAGVAEGELVGGCLSVVAAMLGTPYAPPFDGAILFLEDTGEKAYRIDRMLVQLAQAGVLGRVAGSGLRRVAPARRQRGGASPDRRIRRGADRRPRLPGALGNRSRARQRELYDSRSECARGSTRRHESLASWSRR